jgi:hypothetical protein
LEYLLNTSKGELVINCLLIVLCLKSTTRTLTENCLLHVFGCCCSTNKATKLNKHDFKYRSFTSRIKDKILLAHKAENNIMLGASVSEIDDSNYNPAERQHIRWTGNQNYKIVSLEATLSTKVMEGSFSSKASSQPE